MCPDLGYARLMVNAVLLKLTKKKGNIIYQNTKVLVLSIGEMGHVDK